VNPDDIDGRQYLCAGLTVLSQFPLAAPEATGRPDVVVVDGGKRSIPPEQPSDDVVAEYDLDGKRRYTIARTPTGVIVRFYGFVDFEIDAAHRHVTCFRSPGTESEMVSIMIIGALVAYLSSVKGHLVLHASAVEIDGRALAVVGNSGQGKSTVATLLCGEGFPLVTDDVLPIEVDEERAGLRCIPGGIELRVRQKSENVIERFAPALPGRLTVDGRLALTPPRTSARRLPLGAIVTPECDRTATGIDLRRLGPGEAAMILTRNLRITGWRAPDELRRQFRLVMRTVACTPVLALRLPWGPPFPGDLGDTIVTALASIEEA
jgi:hypothetical protein